MRQRMQNNDEPQQEIVQADQGSLRSIQPVEDQETDREKAERYLLSAMKEMATNMARSAFMGYPDPSNYPPSEKMTLPEKTEDVLKRLAVRGIRPERQGRKK